MADAVVVTGLDELIERMQAFPVEMAKIGTLNMNASLAVLHENVPPYADEPQNSSYDRTGTLGRTLGSSESGGASGGTPDIYTVRKLGGGNVEGKFGTRLDYAEKVIGDTTQAAIHRGRWWTMKTIYNASTKKIIQIWQNVANALASFLDGKR